MVYFLFVPTYMVEMTPLYFFLLLRVAKFMYACCASDFMDILQQNNDFVHQKHTNLI